MARHYNRLDEADEMLEAYVLADDPADREKFMMAALSAVESVMRECADRVRRAREVR